MERAQPPDKKGAFQMVEVGVDGVVGKAEALAELGQVEDGALFRRGHAQQALGRLRFRG